MSRICCRCQKKTTKAFEVEAKFSQGAGGWPMYMCGRCDPGGPRRAAEARRVRAAARQ